MNSEMFENLIHKELTEVITTEEKTMLYSWLDSDESNKQVYKELKAIWSMAGINTEEALIDTDVEQQLLRLQEKAEIKPITNTTPVVKLKKPVPAKNKFAWLKIAAGFAIVLGTVMLLRNFSGMNSSDFVQSTGVNESESIEMVDGTLISLSESSDITFFPHIKSERKVKLVGEAFFDVAKDEAKAFIIETPNAEISVLGTSFTVKTTSENETYLSVKSGTVKIVSTEDGSFKILTKGQRTKVGHSVGNILNPGEIAQDDFDSLLQFGNENLKKIFTSLELKFGQSFEFHESLTNCELSGGLSGKNLDEILAILKTALNIEAINKQDGVITLVGGQCN